MKESNVGKKAKLVHEKPKAEQILEEDLKNLQKKENPSEKVPTIYFGTRTHTQVKQLVKELGTTSYRWLYHHFNVHSVRPLMCVLGSRDHYCIHPKISKKPDKTNEW
jgi:Fanconi anemia group J protein